MKVILLRLLLFFLLALVLFTGLVIYLLRDEDFVTRQLQQRLSGTLGWQLELNGGLAVHWGRNTVLEVQDLRLLNPDWPGQELLFSAAALRLELQPLQLLSRRLVMDDLKLSDCTLIYAENEAGQNNWLPRREDSAHQPGATDHSSFSWFLAKADITSCAVSVMRKRHEEPLDIHIAQGQLQLDAEGNLSAGIRGSLDQQELTLDGHVRPWTALWQGGQLQHEIDLQAGQVRLHTEGSFENFPSGRGGMLDLRFSGPEFGQVTDWLALPEFSSGAFDARLQIRESDPQGQIELNIAADLGNLVIEGRGELDRWLAPDHGRMELDIKGPDLDALARTFGHKWLVARPFAIQLKAAIANSQTQLEHFSVQTGKDQLTASGRLGTWPGWAGSALEINLESADLRPWLEATEAEKVPFGTAALRLELAQSIAGELSLAAMGQLGNRQGQERAIQLQTSLQQQDGRLTVKQVDLKLGADSLKLAGDLNLDRTLAGSQFTARLNVAELAGIGNWLGMPDWPTEALTLSADLSRPGEGLNFHVTDARLADLKFSLSGQMPDIQKPLFMKANFDLAISSLRKAQDILPGTEWPDLPFAAKGEVRLQGSEHPVLKGVDLLLGQTRASLDADLLLQQGMAGSTARWTMQGDELAELWPALVRQVGSGSFSLDGEWQRQPAGDYFKALKFQTAGLALTASGTVSEWTEAANFQLQVEANSPDSSRYQDWLAPYVDSQPMAVKFSVQGTRAHFVADVISLTQGRSSLAGKLDFVMTGRPRISGKINAEVLDLVHAEQHWTALQQQKKQQILAAANAREKRLFSAQPIELFGNSPLDLSLNIQVTRLLLSSNEFREVDLQLDLQEQSLQLDPFAFRGIKGGQYSGRLSSQKRGDQTSISLQARADDLRLGQFGAGGSDAAALPLSDIEVDLEGNGENWQALAQSLRGKLRWYSEAGRISNTGLNLLFSDLVSQIFNTLNPLSKKSKYTELECAVYAADFKDGEMKLAPIVIQTDKVTAFSEGKIDLATEAIDMSFRTVARKGLGLSAGSVVNPFFRIGGTLLDPALQLDVTRGTISGGAMFATAGLSVLFKSMSDRLLSSKTPCADARAGIEAGDKGAPTAKKR